ncbi:expansin EXLX1 family cellulose-binding protein [Sphaerisporangium sp. B11E5]|uniref:expansin EXLX1 family cellulose-binding protein n=1 Tax=Sphaerisporangium sp. B11E5 TaxID=3153563 RepID=UPI00325F6B86
MSVERRHGSALRRAAWTAWISAACTLIVLGAQTGRDAACATAAPPPRPTCDLPSVPLLPVAAVSSAEFAAAAACGSHLDVTGPLGTVRVQVVEECRTCALGELDMSREAFERIAGPGPSRVRVRYHTARNPQMARPVGFRLKPGSSPHWLAIQVVDHGNPLRTLEIRDGATWRRLPRATDNYWVASRGAGPGPYTVRITDMYGHHLTSGGIHLHPTTIQRTPHRLYSPSVASPPPPTRALTSRTTPQASPSPGPRHQPPPGRRGRPPLASRDLTPPPPQDLTRPGPRDLTSPGPQDPTHPDPARLAPRDLTSPGPQDLTQRGLTSPAPRHPAQRDLTSPGPPDPARPGPRDQMSAGPGGPSVPDGQAPAPGPSAPAPAAQGTDASGQIARADTDRHGAAARSDVGDRQAEHREPPPHRGTLTALPTTRPFLC